jgi:inner membrane protein
MASAITHFIVGASVGLAAMPPRRWSVPLTCGLWAAAPDLDTFAMFAFHIPRGSPFSHRGIFHSPFFLALAAFAVAYVARRGKDWLVLGALWTCAAVTHPLLDMLTDGGSGVMLLFPLSAERFFFPWRPIRVSSLTIARFVDRAGPILLSELPFALAALLAGGGILLLRTRRAVRQTPSW